MPQEDYIKRAKPKPKAKRKAPARKPSKQPTETSATKKKLIIISLLIVLLSGFIAFLWGIDGSADTEAEQPKEKPVKTVKTPKQKTNEIPAYTNKNDWEYVDALKNKTVSVDVKELEKKGPFMMQCGSFRRQDQADSLKAKIAFAGFEADVKRSNGKNGVWYRVVIDEFETKRQAESARHRLKKNSINGCRIWASKSP